MQKKVSYEALYKVPLERLDQRGLDYNQYLYIFLPLFHVFFFFLLFRERQFIISISWRRSSLLLKPYCVSKWQHQSKMFFIKPIKRLIDLWYAIEKHPDPDQNNGDLLMIVVVCRIIWIVSLALWD